MNDIQLLISKLNFPAGSKKIERDKNRCIERDRTFSISFK